VYRLTNNVQAVWSFAFNRATKSIGFSSSAPGTFHPLDAHPIPKRVLKKFCESFRHFASIHIEGLSEPNGRPDGSPPFCKTEVG
jgi:hypothetical protein